MIKHSIIMSAKNLAAFEIRYLLCGGDTNQEVSYLHLGSLKLSPTMKMSNENLQQDKNSSYN